MFSVGRPSVIALGQNYHLPEHALQYKSLQYFYRAGTDGKVRLGLTARAIRTHRTIGSR